jgi:hypothetical protein
VVLRVQFRDQVVVAKPGLGRGHPHEADRREAVVQALAQLLGRFEALRDPERAGDEAQSRLIGGEMVAPDLADLSHGAGRGRPIEEPVEIERVRLLEYDPHQRIIVVEPPVRDELEAHTLPARRMLHLRGAGPLEEGLRGGVGEGGVDQVGITKLAWPHMPFALVMVAQNWASVMILRRVRRIIFYEHIVEGLRSRLVGNADHRSARVEELGIGSPSSSGNTGP